ncbi:TPA: hypothetical protein ACPFI9_003754 [Providencia rettgeri]
MFGSKVRFVIDVFPTESAGIEAVFVFVGGRRNHRTIKLSVLFDVDIKATFCFSTIGISARL